MIEQLNDCVEKWQNICQKNDSISPRLYDEYGVNLGLRDEKGNGVLCIKIQNTPLDCLKISSAEYAR